MPTGPAYHDQPDWMADANWRVAFRPHTPWRAGSRRAFADVIIGMWSRIEMQRLAWPETPLANGRDYREESGGPALEWFVGEAIRAGYITDAAAGRLLGPSAAAARLAVREVWDFAVDPVFAADRRHAARERQVIERIMTIAQRAAVRGDDQSARKVAWREIVGHPEFAAQASSRPASPDWSIDWPSGTPAERTGPGQWHVLVDEVGGS